MGGGRRISEPTLWLLRRLLEVLFYLGLAVWLWMQLCRALSPVCLADEGISQGGPYPWRHVIYLPVVYRATGLTPGLRDGYEPDDAVPRRMSTGETQTHNFHPEGDLDNVHFTVRKGHWYQVSTSDLAPGVDTEITVMVNGVRYTSNDVGPGHPESRVLCQAIENDLAVVKIVNRGCYGPGKTYRISLVGTETPVIPTATPTSEPYPWPPTPTGTPPPTTTPTSEPASGWVWSELHLPEGEDFWGFFARNETAFVTVERQGQAYTCRSDNRGEHWQELGGAAREVRAWRFCFSPSFGQDGTVFGARSSVARSTDGGGTWARRDSGFSISFVDDIAFVPGYRYPHGAIYLITTYVDGHRHLYRSTNNGDWWELRMHDTAPSHKTIFYHITAMSADEVLLARSGGLWRSEDGGVSWEEVTDFPPGAYGLEPDGGGKLWASSSGGTYISTDGGRSWHPFSLRPPGSNPAVYGGDGLVLAKVDKQESGSLYELRDGGWHVLRDGLDRHNSYVAVATRDLTYLVQPSGVERGVRTR